MYTNVALSQRTTGCKRQAYAKANLTAHRRSWFWFCLPVMLTWASTIKRAKRSTHWFCSPDSRAICRIPRSYGNVICGHTTVSASWIPPKISPVNCKLRASNLALKNSNFRVSTSFVIYVTQISWHFWKTKTFWTERDLHAYYNRLCGAHENKTTR